VEPKNRPAPEWEEAYAPGAGPLRGTALTEFLRGREFLKLAVLTEEGWPYVVPLWYDWDGSSFWLVGRKRSLWVRHLLSDSRCSICVEEKQAPSIRKVLAQCHGQVVEGPCVAAGSKWVQVANKMAERYRGPDGPGLLEGSHNWERYLVKVTPVDGHLTTWQGPDWARKYFDPGQRPDLGGTQ
jgi:Pyridoxamine 5'-phosphate oxidase